jgi:Cof subfamily protein (haloacid dehalogenase superfamily)
MIENPFYKAVAFDLDGTLLHSDKTISTYTLETIDKLKTLGFTIIIATGRSRESAESFRKILDLHTPIVCYNGACVIDADTGEELVHLTIAEHISREIVRLSREYHMALHAYHNHKLFFEAASMQANSYESLSRGSSFMVDFDNLEKLAFTKAMYIGDVTIIEEIRKRLEVLFPGALSKVYTYLNYFEIMHAKANKGNALAHVVEKLGIKREQTIAFGDGENDLEMIEWAGHGVTMENAPETVKANARHIAGPNNEDGVAKYLTKLLGL